jgi:hypothetical protein
VSDVFANDENGVGLMKKKFVDKKILRYFRLTYMKYEKTRKYDCENPIKIVHRKWIPGINCPVCSPWAGSARTYRKIEDEKAIQYLNSSPLTIDKWKEMEIQVRKYIQISENEELFPGETIGVPAIDMFGKANNDFLFPWTFEIIVNEKVKDVFCAEKIKGVSFIPITISKNASNYIENLFLMNAFLSNNYIEPNKERCKVCNRPLWTKDYTPNPYNYNEEQFDIFTPVDNPNFTFINDRAKEIIINNHFTNVCIEEMEYDN